MKRTVFKKIVEKLRDNFSGEIVVISSSKRAWENGIKQALIDYLKNEGIDSEWIQNNNVLTINQYESVIEPIFVKENNIFMLDVDEYVGG